MTAITTAVTNVLGVVGTVITTVTSEPVLALGLGFSVVCGAIGVFRRLF